MSENNSMNESAEFAVRRYLEFLADPSTAVDGSRVAELEGQVAETADVIAKLKLLEDLGRARSGDTAALRQAFVTHAKSWAAANNIGLDAFRALGVGDIALVEAGFDLGRNAPKKASAATSRAVRPVRAVRATNVSGSAIREHIAGLVGTFTLASVMHDVGGSLGTIRKVVEELESAGRVRNEGADPAHSSRGRAPHMFRVI